MGFFDKIKQGLEKTRRQMGGLFAEFTGENEEFFEELEDSLILADAGVDTAMKAVEELRERVRTNALRGPEEVKGALVDILAEHLSVGSFELKLETKPSVILMVGVNGVGKTTTIGKLAARYTAEGKKVQLAAADTFRAAAAEQLTVWADRAGVRIVKHEEGSDPSAVVFDAISSAKAKGTDVLLVDTAGRLHVKANLMEELKKISRVISREYPQAHVYKLLVLDATTGNNAINQARIFDEAVELDGIVLTKLDSTAKGGFVISLCGELEIPVVFVGTGEKIGDLEKFDPESFIDSIL